MLLRKSESHHCSRRRDIKPNRFLVVCWNGNSTYTNSSWSSAILPPQLVYIYWLLLTVILILLFYMKCIRFCLNLPPRSHIDPSHFRKINWLPVSGRVEYCIANTVFIYWNGIEPGNVHEMCKPSLGRYSTRSQMALGIPLRKTNTGQKSLSFLRPNIWSKIGPSIRASSSFMHAIKKSNLLHLRS